MLSALHQTIFALSNQEGKMGRIYRAREGDEKCLQNFVVKAEVKRPVGRPRRR
jgi:hypothetical protein